MIPGRSSIEALITGKVFMGEIGAFFPVSMTLRGDEFAAVFMMRASQLGHRTTGPYTPDRPPADAMNWAQLRTGIGMAGRFPPSGSTRAACGRASTSSCSAPPSAG